MDTRGGLYCTNGVTAQTVNQAMARLTAWNGRYDSHEIDADLTNDRVVVCEAGDYEFTVNISGTGSANRVFDMHVMKNGVKVDGSGINRSGSANNILGGSATTLLACAVGDVIEVHISADQNGSSFTCTEGSLTAFKMR